MTLKSKKEFTISGKLFVVRLLDDNCVMFSGSHTRLQTYECETGESAQQTYNTIVDTITDVCAILKNKSKSSKG